MSVSLSIGGPGAGLWMRTEEALLTTHKALVEGDVVAVSPTVNAAGEFYLTANADGGLLTAGIAQGIFAVCTGTIADGDTGRFVIAGRTKVLCSGNPALGAGISVKSGATNDIVTAAINSKVVGYMLELGVNTELKTALFDGRNGFCTRGA